MNGIGMVVYLQSYGCSIRKIRKWIRISWQIRTVAKLFDEKHIDVNADGNQARHFASTQNNRIQLGWFSICLLELRNLNGVVVICRLEQASNELKFTLFNYGVHSLTKIRNWLPSFKCGRYAHVANALSISGKWESCQVLQFANALHRKESRKWLWIYCKLKSDLFL